MKFGPWYPLAEAREHAPADEGVFQLRQASGLIDYPRGKSAMVYYGHATDVRAAAVAWAAGACAVARGAALAGLLCRHLIERDDAGDLAAFHAKLVEEFARRFGAEPKWQR